MVDPQVAFLDGRTVDVLFIATDNGVIFKAINTQAPEGTRWVFVLFAYVLNIEQRHSFIGAFGRDL